MKALKIIAILGGIVVFLCVGLIVIGTLAGAGQSESGGVAAAVTPTAPPNYGCASKQPGNANAPVPETTREMTVITYSVVAVKTSMNSHAVLCNTTGEVRGEARVSFKFFGADGKLIESTWTDPKGWEEDNTQYLGTSMAVWPGQLTMVALGTEKRLDNYARVEVSVESKKINPEPIIGLEITRDLTVSDIQVQPSKETGGLVIGKVTNNSKKTLKSAFVGATAYDSAGALLTTQVGFAKAGELKPGESTTFELQMNTLFAEPAAMEYIVEGHVKD